MLTRRTYWWYLGILAALAFVAWAGLVPGRMSGSTFVWISAVVIALLAVSLMAMRAGGPTRSVAHVLHDAEHQKGASR